MNEKSPIFSDTGNYIEHEKESQSKNQLQSWYILFDYINEQLLLLLHFLHLSLFWYFGGLGYGPNFIFFQMVI